MSESGIESLGHTTVVLVENQLNVETSFSSSTIPSKEAVERWIMEATNKIDEITEFRYSSEEITDILDYKGLDYLLTSRAPISDVTVYLNTASMYEEPVWEELDLYSDYLLEEDKGRITLHFKGKAIREGKQKFKVTYIGGLEVAPFSIQELCTRMVALRVLEALIGSKARSTDGTQIRVGSVSVINPADYGINNFKSLREGVAKDLQDLKGNTRGIRYVNY